MYVTAYAGQDMLYLTKLSVGNPLHLLFDKCLLLLRFEGENIIGLSLSTYYICVSPLELFIGLNDVCNRLLLVSIMYLLSRI